MSKTLAIYKARLGESFQENSLVINEIMPRLVVAEGIDIKSNTLNNRDQRLRVEHGMFSLGFNDNRIVNGVKEVPKEVAKSAKKHSAEQWLHVRSTINVCNDSTECEGTIYLLRASMDLPQRTVELFKELNLRVPKVRNYLEAYHGVWTFFFPQHYSDTMDLRMTDPTAFLPLPEYVFSQDDSAPSVFADSL